MSLQGHERATRILALAMKEEAAKTAGTYYAVLFALGHAYELAADRMEEAIRAEASGGAKP